MASTPPSPSPSKRCSACRRLLAECNKEPCPAKALKKAARSPPASPSKPPRKTPGSTPSPLSSSNSATLSQDDDNAPPMEFLVVPESEVNPKRLVQSTLFGYVSLDESVSDATVTLNPTPSAPRPNPTESAQEPEDVLPLPTWVKLEATSLNNFKVDETALSALASNLSLSSPEEEEHQETLLATLISERVLFHRAHAARVVAIDSDGLCVDVTVERALGQGTLLLPAQRILWHDFPDEVRSWSQPEQLRRTRQFLGVGSEFRVKVLDTLGRGRVRLVLHAQAQPKLRIPLPPKSVTVTPRCPFPYLVIVDFEATCDYAPEPAVTAETAEIIEFPWVVIDTRTLTLADSRRLYVRPSSLVTVTHYTTLLTGITAAQVADAPPLAQALKEFTNYISHHFKDDRSLFRIVTDGIWDLQVQLRWEAKRKGLILPWYLNEYIDLQEEFRNFLPWFPPDFRCNLQAMLKAFGYEFSGRAHSGLDDALNISRVTAALLALEHPFARPKVIPPLYDAHQDPRFLDFGSRAEPDAWLCDTKGCGIWNRPWMFYCRFCEQKRRADSISLPFFTDEAAAGEEEEEPEEGGSDVEEGSDAESNRTS